MVLGFKKRVAKYPDLWHTCKRLEEVFSKSDRIG